MLKAFGARSNILKISRCSLSSTAPALRSTNASPIILDDGGDVRKSLAPWIRIGEYERGLLSHLSGSDVLRALFVLRLCSLDTLVDKSSRLFDLALKFGPLAKWPLRKTFFDQFVGGEDVVRMTTVVSMLQKRGLRLMVAPVLEEDVNDQASSRNTYDTNLSSLIELAEMCESLEKRKALLQLKLSAIMPASALDEASKIINVECMDAGSLARLAENLERSIDNPAALSLNLSESNKTHFLEGLQRADCLVKKAQELSILVVVDAEFFSCQSAIAAVAVALMSRYNQRGYLIGNTIQGYLKSATQMIETELEVVTKLMGANWYGKIVRGAYMDRERMIARSQGIPSPINDTYEDTNRSYNRCIQTVLEHIAENKSTSKTHLLVASHNEKSIRCAAQHMQNLDIKMNDDKVSFAQIYGMADYLSTPLVEKGYTVYKSTPYGPMEKVMPYLTRRASENRSVINGAREERNMLWQELMHRLRSSIRI